MPRQTTYESSAIDSIEQLSPDKRVNHYHDRFAALHRVHNPDERKGLILEEGDKEKLATTNEEIQAVHQLVSGARATSLQYPRYEKEVVILLDEIARTARFGNNRLDAFEELTTLLTTKERPHEKEEDAVLRTRDLLTICAQILRDETDAVTRTQGEERFVRALLALPHDVNALLKTSRHADDPNRQYVSALLYQFTPDTISGKHFARELRASHIPRDTYLSPRLEIFTDSEREQMQKNIPLKVIQWEMQKMTALPLDDDDALLPPFSLPTEKEKEQAKRDGRRYDLCLTYTPRGAKKPLALPLGYDAEQWLTEQLDAAQNNFFRDRERRKAAPKEITDLLAQTIFDDLPPMVRRRLSREEEKQGKEWPAQFRGEGARLAFVLHEERDTTAITLVEKVRQEYASKLAKPSVEIEDLAGVYSDEKIKKDSEKLERLREKQKEKVPELAALAEEIFGWLAEKNGWLGTCKAIRLSEYDDRAHGSDYVIEWKQKNGTIVRLGIDITITNDPTVLLEKREGVRKRIDKGTLGTLEYFPGPAGPALTRLPQVIINLGPDHMEQLNRDLLHTSRQQKIPRHYLQRSVQTQIAKMLMYEIAYAQETHCPDDVLAPLRDALQIMTKIIGEKSALKEKEEVELGPNIQPSLLERALDKGNIFQSAK